MYYQYGVNWKFQAFDVSVRQIWYKIFECVILMKTHWINLFQSQKWYLLTWCYLSFEFIYLDEWKTNKSRICKVNANETCNICSQYLEDCLLPPKNVDNNLWPFYMHIIWPSIWMWIMIWCCYWARALPRRSFLQIIESSPRQKKMSNFG